jgi:ornithine cyclodeaminase/alanine dehydrogenase-like protein (mu-crystallin family)
MNVAIEAMRRAFAALSDGRAEVPLRPHLAVPEHGGVCLVMPALVDGDEHGHSLAVKVVSLFEGNAGRGLARIQAAVLAIDPQTGQAAALLEGAMLTAIRTGAAAGAATDLLARPDAQTAAVIGAGVQARTQLEAVCSVRPIRTAWVYDPRTEAAESLVGSIAGQGSVPADLRVAATPREAVAEADVISTVTTSAEPVFDDADLKPGAHVNALGSYQPHVREIPPETVVRALVVVDSREAALTETGDLIGPIEEGLITADHVRAELGELLLGRAAGRTRPEQLTLFEAVGVAVQDAVAANVALERAGQLGLGQHVPL